MEGAVPQLQSPRPGRLLQPQRYLDQKVSPPFRENLANVCGVSPRCQRDVGDATEKQVDEAQGTPKAEPDRKLPRPK
ncbi:hypothetical protein HDV00_012574, partial [Rhizophlyctis rosea]